MLEHGCKLARALPSRAAARIEARGASFDVVDELVELESG